MPDTTDPQTVRPEVDDPRVLALAKARQHIAHSSPFNFVCPPWDGLTSDEQQLSLLDARNYLHAALDAGLVPAAPVAAPPTGQTDEERARISAKLWEVAEHHIVAEWICCEPLAPKHTLCAKGYAALGMARSLLVDADPAEAWNPEAPLLDAVLAELEQAQQPVAAVETDTLHGWYAAMDADGPGRVADEEQPDDYEATTGHAVTCLAVAGGDGDPDCPACNPQFGIDGCTCIPFTRQGGAPRYCGPTDTVDMISGWEPGADCPHHAPPTPLLRSGDACPGFPEHCPNLRTVDPNPPVHFGGIRCGCADTPPTAVAEPGNGKEV